MIFIGIMLVVIALLLGIIVEDLRRLGLNQYTQAQLLRLIHQQIKYGSGWQPPLKDHGRE